MLKTGRRLKRKELLKWNVLICTKDFNDAADFIKLQLVTLITKI